MQVGGIKFSPELVQYTCRQLAAADASLPVLLRQLAGRRVNLTYFCSDRDGDLLRSTFCVAAAAALEVDALLAALPPDDGIAGDRRWADRVQRLAGIGTLTVFPHRRSPTLLGRVVAALAGAGITIHSLCTSISALSVNIDYLLLDRAVAVLAAVIDLPEHHSPFRPEFAVTQIIRPVPGIF